MSLRSLGMQIAFVLAVLGFGPAAMGASEPSADPYAEGRELIADLGRIVTPDGVKETYEVTLGGMRQVVNVRGSDRRNPILLFVHGGPASVEMPMAWTFQRPWEDYFTVVQWDQRGAGRSYPLNDPAKIADTLKPDRYRDDAIELIELLRRKYDAPKVVLMGYSWGSFVGLAVAAKRPDLLYAYVGVGQGIDFRENERVGYAWTLERARAEHDEKALRELEAIAPYPGEGPLDFAKTTVQRTWSVRYGGLAAHRSDANFYFRSTRLSPEYTPADRRAWDDGAEFTMKLLWPQLASVSYASLRRLEVPVVLLLGRHDYTTPSTIAYAWLQRLDAPAKSAVWFEHSAHMPMVEEPGRVLVTLVRDVLPHASAGSRGPTLGPAHRHP
jgi:pimeloyl-ACP methyl ester carboxylesterase